MIYVRMMFVECLYDLRLMSSKCRYYRLTQWSHNTITKIRRPQWPSSSLGRLPWVELAQVRVETLEYLVLTSSHHAHQHNQDHDADAHAHHHHHQHHHHNPPAELLQLTYQQIIMRRTLSVLGQDAIVLHLSAACRWCPRVVCRIARGCANWC